MPENASPYVIHMQPQFAPLETIDLPSLVETVTDEWFNQTLCRVNDSLVRLGVVHGEYHWHAHDDDDEFFYVVDGELLIELADTTLRLQPQQGVTIPQGVQHRPIAPQRTIMLMIESTGITPTGE